VTGAGGAIEGRDHEEKSVAGIVARLGEWIVGGGGCTRRGGWGAECNPCAFLVVGWPYFGDKRDIGGQRYLLRVAGESVVLALGHGKAGVGTRGGMGWGGGRGRADRSSAGVGRMGGGAPTGGEFYCHACQSSFAGEGR